MGIVKAIFITVRSSSTRLPNKCFRKIKERHTIEYVIDRAKRSTLADCVVLCTTQLAVDDRLCDIAEKNGILYFRGSEEDKLERWRGACDKFGIEFFVTADGDDLFCDPGLMDQALAQFENNKDENDFIKSDDVICGAFTYGIKASALRKVCKIKKTTDTEMMWVYFTDTGLFSVKKLDNIDPKFIRSDIRMTMDYEEDLKFFTKVLDNFENTDYTLHDIVDFIDKSPDVKQINFHRHQEWAQNQRSKTKLVVV